MRDPDKYKIKIKRLMVVSGPSGSYLPPYTRKRIKKKIFLPAPEKDPKVPKVTTLITVSSDSSWLEEQRGEYHYKFRGTTYPSQWWQGEQLADPVCIDLETDVRAHLNIILMSAFDGAGVYRVRPTQLTEFVELHKNHQIICHNSWFDIGNLTRSTNRLDGLQGMVRENRLQDTLALSMLVSLAEGDPYGNDLGTVAKP